MMTTNKNLWISTAIALGLCAITFFWQRSGIRAVRGEIEELRRVVSTAPRPMDLEGPAAREMASTAESGKPSAEELVAMLSYDEGDMAGSFVAFAGMLDHIKHYSTDEVLDLIEELGDLIEKDESREQKLGFPKVMLMVIVADEAPERILEMAEASPDEVRSAAFGALAKKDPQRAQEHLEGVEWPVREVQMAKAAIFSSWLERDVLKALELFRDGGWNLNSSATAAIGNACIDPANRAKLWKAAREETVPAVSLQLSKGLMVGELLRGGAAGIREAFATADFFDAKLKAELVDEFAGNTIASEPDETVAWIRESVPPQDVPQAIADALRAWAHKDFNAAGTWLGKQPASPERDRAIAGYASTVSRIDPTAAATWASEIADQNLRSATLEKTLKQWKAKDPAAAAAWSKARAQPE